MTLGERIAYYRGKLGLSQGELAEQLGVSRQAVSKWETDAGLPDLERLIAAEREKLSEADRAQMEVVLWADKDAPMADLADAMDASRRAHAFRLKLTAEASDPGIVRMLPPDPLRLPADSADYALPATNRNDR